MGLKVLKENEEGFGIIITEGVGFISAEQNKGFLTEINNSSEPFDLNKPFIVYATLQKYEEQNRNGRVYPKDILMREVERYKNEFIAKNTNLGELDHPDSSVISLKLGAPHRILDLYWEGNALIGKLEILISRGYRDHGGIYCGGDMVAHYLSYGVTLGISSRGVGTLKKVNGQNVVQDDFELICWDIVSSPSTPGSYIYRNPGDFKKYDETLPTEKSTPALNKQQDLMNRLNKFLGK
jgi:hypothetical protein